jgi:hypothetical protein
VQRFETQIDEVKNQIQGVETSQSFISDKYENVIEVTQSIKKEMKTVQSHRKESNERLECLEKEASYNMAVLDEVQQYLRRDCLEITGIPIVPLDDSSTLVSEVCSAMDIELQEDDISIAHRLPSTTKVKDRIIVKFVKRSKRDEVYKHRSKLRGKSTANLPTVNAEIQEGSIRRSTKIHINESLTGYRRRLFGKVNAFKNANKYKFIWTTNGTIHLRETESSSIYHFNTLADYENLIKSSQQTEDYD